MIAKNVDRDGVLTDAEVIAAVKGSCVVGVYAHITEQGCACNREKWVVDRRMGRVACAKCGGSVDLETLDNMAQEAFEHQQDSIDDGEARQAYEDEQARGLYDD